MKKRKFSEGLFDIEPILKALKIGNGQTILDAGCGNGYMAKIFSKSVGNSGKIYAFDIEKESIKKLKKETKNTNIQTFIGNITETTELQDGSIDLVYLSTVFHIFSAAQIVSFEKEVRRILKPKGKLAIVNIKKKSTAFGPPVEMRSSPEELRHKLSFSSGVLIDVGEHFYMQIFFKT